MVAKKEKKVTVKKTTVKEVKTLEERATEVREKLNSDLDTLFEKISSEKYDSQAYKKDTVLEVTGETFTLFINTNAENKRVLDAVQRNLVVAFNTIDALLTENAKLSVALMQQHIKNIDAEKTIHNTKLVEENGKS